MTALRVITGLQFLISGFSSGPNGLEDDGPSETEGLLTGSWWFGGWRLKKIGERGGG